MRDEPGTDLAARLRTGLAGRYAIERELGRGGMAIVFLATDLRHGRPVALKVLAPDLAAGVGADRFSREIQIAARLTHPHILALIDSGETQGLLYYVMPYLEGESLRDRLVREKQLPLDQALQITREVADALSYAHAHGIVHRDIKPENILFQAGHAMVADFGIAMALSAASHQRLTQTGLAIGTPAYMSPEQATGADVDARSDTYSLACVTYEMLTGSPPFTGATPQAILARHSVDAVPRPGIVRPSVSPAVERALLKALAKMPADRFPTALAFTDALSGAGPITERAPHRVARTLQRRRVRLVGTLASLGLLVVLGGLWWRRHQAEGGDRQARADPRRLAVLYFRAIGSDSLRPIAEGFTEGLIRELSRARTLHVISANGVRPFRGVDVSPDSLGRALGVGSLVEGTLTQVGSRLRLSVSLVSTDDGTVLGSTSFERPASDVLALQDSLAASVTAFLRPRLGELVQLREDRDRTHSAEAWRSLQEARAATRLFDSLLNAGDTILARVELARADTLLARARGLDRRWATPLVERGWLAWHSRYLMGTLAPAWTDTWTRLGLRYADSALSLSPNDPDALALRGTSHYFRFVLGMGADAQAVRAGGDSAETDLRAATTTDPYQTYAWTLLSHRLMRSGKVAEGKLAAMRAYEADPYDNDTPTTLWRLYAASLDLEDRQEATRWCEIGKARYANDPSFVECQITVQVLPGQTPDIPTLWRLLDQNVRLYPPNQRAYRLRRGQLLVAMAIARTGLEDSARAVAVRARADAAIDPSSDLVFVEMLLRNLLADRDEALRLAAEWYAANPQERSVCASGNAGDGTWWTRGLREDPRYQAIACTGR